MTRHLAFIAILGSSIMATSAFAAQNPPASEETAGQPAPPEPAPAAPADDAASLAKKLSNPIASLISVPFQFNMDFGDGLTDDGDKERRSISSR